MATEAVERVNKQKEAAIDAQQTTATTTEAGRPAIPSAPILCIAATRQGSPFGSLRSVLTGPVRAANT
jgi:hypothetical protein